MTDEELDKLEVAYFLRFHDGPTYPRDGLTNEEKADIVRKAIETGVKLRIRLPEPEPGSIEYLVRLYIERFGEIPNRLYLPNHNSPAYREYIEKALRDGKPIDYKAIQASLPPGAVI